MKQWPKRKAAYGCTLHIDDQLMREAQRNKGHISVKAVSDEYDRLLKSRLRRQRLLTFLSRLLQIGPE